MAQRRRPDDSRTLILCFDGTLNEFNNQVALTMVTRVVCWHLQGLTLGLQNTNVMKLFNLLDKDHLGQLCYYQVRFQRAVSKISGIRC